MIRESIFALYLCFSTTISFGQSVIQVPEFNFGFEKITPNEKLPDDWFRWGTGGYQLLIDTVETKSGKASVRIETVGEKAANTFGCVAYSLPAQFKGKEMELRASMKYSNVAEGVVGLLLRIDGATGSLAFDNLQSKNIQGTADWTVFSVKVPYPEQAKTIYVGALLSGTGQLWVDDFQLFLDGKELRKSDIVLKTYKADKDKEFDNGSGITTIDLSGESISDLATLGKIWGFLKYYHPAVANGDYHWDYELFRILPGILDAKDQTERNKRLLAWIDQLGKYQKNKDIQKSESEVKLRPDLAWMEDPGVSKQLRTKLNEIRNAQREEEHYYVELASGVGNPIFNNERAYIQMKYPDPGFRLLSLYRYWNIIAYYFPYKNLIEEDWDEVLKEFIPKFVNATNEFEYRMAVLALIARVHDTHANIWGQDSIIRSFHGIHHAPLEVKFIENKAVVTGYMDDALGEASGLKAGDIIERINHRPVEEIVRMKLPLTPASNYPTQLRDIARNLLRTNDSTVLIEYRRDDNTFTADVRCVDFKAMNLSNQYMKKDTCYKLIAPGIAWLYPGNIRKEYLSVIMPEILKAKGLIIDFRCYPGDFIVFPLSEYLLPKPTSFVKFSTGSITSPGLFSMGEALNVGSMTDDYFKGKVVIIVNEVTQSSAEYHTMAFRTAPGAVVIGSTTAGADGNVSRFYLPGGIMTMISGIGVYYPDGTETQRIGIVPDIEVKPTIKGIQEGRDEVMERAIEIINAQ